MAITISTQIKTITTERHIKEFITRLPLGGGVIVDVVAVDVDRADDGTVLGERPAGTMRLHQEDLVRMLPDFPALYQTLHDALHAEHERQHAPAAPEPEPVE